MASPTPTRAKVFARHGEQWFERDAQEIAKTDERSKGLALYAVYLSVITALAIGWLILFPPHCSATPDDFRSGRLPAWALATFRGVCGLFCSIIFVRRGLSESSADEETLDRRPIHLTSHGVWRMQGLTQWQFGIICVYFIASATLTMTAISRADDKAWLSTPSTASCAAETLLGVAFALAVLTTVVVTFVLVPSKIRNGTSAHHFFGFDELVMHNFNSFSLVLDLLGGHLSIHVRRMSASEDL